MSEKPSMKFKRTLLATTALLASSVQFAMASGCSIEGNGTVDQCDGTLISITPVSGVFTATVDSVTSVGLDFYPDHASTDALHATLNVTGRSTLYRADYPTIAWQSDRANVNLIVNLGPQLIVLSDLDFGAVWLRNDTSGDLEINSSATVTATGEEQDGITLTSNSGNASLSNSGTVTSQQARGLYADGGGVEEVLVSIVNDGWVESALAGARAINYNGLATVTNNGTVETHIRQGLVAWSNLGPAAIYNTGTVTAQDDSALVAWTETGNATISNSGTAISQNDTSKTDEGIGHYGLHARISNSGDVEITNTATKWKPPTTEFGLKRQMGTSA